MLQNKVFLRENDHRYFDYDGNEYISWSRFIDLFSPKFDKEYWSKKIATRDNKSQEEVIADWDKKRDDSCDHGNRIHDTIEYFAKNFKMRDGCADLEPMVLSIFSDYKEYNKLYSEEVLYTRFGIAGKCDKVLQISSHKNSFIDVEDFKTNLRRGIEPYDKYRNFFHAPIDHLGYCSLNKYTLQLSMYAFMLEELTGKKIRTLWLRYIPPQDKMAHVRMPVPYMKAEIRLLISEYMRMKQEQQMVINSNIEEQPNF